MMSAFHGFHGTAAGMAMVPTEIFPKPSPVAVENNHLLGQTVSKADDGVNNDAAPGVTTTTGGVAVGEEPESAEDAEDRLARSRERNREHARRTRLRKKAQLRALQDRVRELQEEGRILRQTVEECSIASILLGLSSSSNSSGEGDKEKCADGAAADGNFSQSATATAASAMNFDPTAGAVARPDGRGGNRRKRFLLDPSSDAAPRPMKLRIHGKLTTIGGDEGKAHINWKTGVYCDEDGVHKQLSTEELETLRRERNRMHAKMTRDRKKSFISAVERTIEELERENSKMRDTLAKQAKRHFPSSAAATASTSAAASSAPDLLPTQQQQETKANAVVSPECTPLPSPGRVSPAKQLQYSHKPLLQPVLLAAAATVSPPLTTNEQNDEASAVGAGASSASAVPSPLSHQAVAPQAVILPPLAPLPSGAAAPTPAPVLAPAPLPASAGSVSFPTPSSLTTKAAPALHPLGVIGNVAGLFSLPAATLSKDLPPPSASAIHGFSIMG